MKAVILAAGKGERMKPFTDEIPKALVRIKEKPMLVWNLEYLKEAGVNEVCIVVGEKKEQIKEEIGNDFLGMKVTFIEQPAPVGNGDALSKTESYIGNENFWMLSCDVIPPTPLLLRLKEAVEGKECAGAMLAEEITQNIERCGVIQSEEGWVQSILEKPKEKMDKAMVNRSTYYFTPVIFKELKNITPNARTQEYWLTDGIQRLIDSGNKIALIQGKQIVDVATPEDVARAVDLI